MNNSKLFYWSVVAALAGFLFGFDTVVISGANQPIRGLWNTSEWFHGFFIMSMALWGTLIGAMFGGIPTEKYGRKKVLFWIGILYTLSALGSGLAPDPFTFSFSRFIGGIGVGISSVAAPAYIAEISTARSRGRLAAMYQFNIVFGILLAYLSNFLLKGVGGEHDWRWMLGVETIPAMIYTLAVLGIPESPRWLVSIKDEKASARKILIDAGAENPEAEIDEIIRSNAEIATSGKKENIFTAKYSKPLLLAFFVSFFNQLSGINFILYYAPEILGRAGLAERESLMNSIAIGGVNLIFTFVGLYLIDRMGRKKLLLIGSFGYIISLVMVAYAYYAGTGPVFLMTFLLLFIASHAVGQGAVIWVLISEIFPNQARALGQSFGASVHWVCAAVITLVGPVVINALEHQEWKIFAFFAGMMVFQLIWVVAKVPETKGVSLEQLEKQLIKH